MESKQTLGNHCSQHRDDTRADKMKTQNNAAELHKTQVAESTRLQLVRVSEMHKGLPDYLKAGSRLRTI